MMASFVLEDLTGGIEVLVFPRVYAQTSTFGNDDVIVVVGRYNIRDEEKKIFAEKITKLEDLKPSGENRKNMPNLNSNLLQVPTPTSNSSQTATKRLFLRFSNEKSDLMQIVLSIIQRFPGSQPVYFYFEDTKKVLEVKRKFWVNDRDELTNALREVMDQHNIVWQQTKNFA